MITTTELKEQVMKYRDFCIERQKEPTYSGLAAIIGTSAPTIRHIYKGEYRNGKTYTNRPHVTRIVRNDDFELIRNLYDRRD